MYEPCILSFLLLAARLADSSSFTTVIVTNTVTVPCNSPTWTSTTTTTLPITSTTVTTMVTLTADPSPTPFTHGCWCNVNDNPPTTASNYTPAQSFSSGVPLAPSSRRASGPYYPLPSGVGDGNFPTASEASSRFAYGTGSGYGPSGFAISTGSGSGPVSAGLATITKASSDAEPWASLPTREPGMPGY